jgi:5'-nucleotidase
MAGTFSARQRKLAAGKRRVTRRGLLPLLAAALVAGSGPAGARTQPFRPAPQYRILVSNDDGVRAPGLAAVAQILQAIGDVTVVAPSENQSGKGHSITVSGPIIREDITLSSGLKAIGLSTTPASAVHIALRNIMTPRPDLVVSGINRGYNLAYSAYVSGTLGAARQAAMHGVPAVAASLAEAGAPRDFVAAAEEVLGVARRVKQYGLPPNTFLNVNVPPMPEGGYKGYHVTTQALAPGGEESFAETKDPAGRPVYWNVYKEGASGAEGTDLWAVERGYVSVTPMKIGETDTARLDALRSLFK